jgi:hypothetical protein
LLNYIYSRYFISNPPFFSRYKNHAIIFPVTCAISSDSTPPTDPSSRPAAAAAAAAAAAVEVPAEAAAVAILPAEQYSPAANHSPTPARWRPVVAADTVAAVAVDTVQATVRVEDCTTQARHCVITLSQQLVLRPLGLHKIAGAEDREVQLLAETASHMCLDYMRGSQAVVAAEGLVAKDPFPAGMWDNMPPELLPVAVLVPRREHIDAP